MLFHFFREKFPTIARTLLLACWLSLFPFSTLAAEKNGATIDDTRTALEQWVETQRVISKEKRDLELAKEMLNERIAIVQREIQSLKEKMAETKKSIAEADKKRAEMMDENEKLKTASTGLETLCTTLEEKTKTFLPRLPDPIREHVKPLSQRIQTNSEEKKETLSARFQNIVGILNEIDKFNQDIKVTSEVRSLPDGTNAEVTAMYLGIGQGYYTGAKGTIAGIGTASETGWVWKSMNEATAAITKAIAILKNEEAASFVHLPIEIQ